MQRRVRDSRAGYLQSLEVLRAAKDCGVYTKSSIMLGLGETDEEIVDTLLDLRDCGVDIVTFGQYLQPTERHLKVVEFVAPEKFEHWRQYGEEQLGFRCGCGHTVCVTRHQVCSQQCVQSSSPLLLCKLPAILPVVRWYVWRMLVFVRASSSERMILCRYIASGPLVRSSYKAGEFFLEAMIRQDQQPRAAAV